jgi:DNA mismatch endonuclease (patch repair protein)
MARIRGADTTPERKLRAALAFAGVRIGSGRSLPGRPDIVVADARIAIFVHGCFWHGCRKHYRRPQTRPELWDAKLARTKARDARVARRLRMEDWSVRVAWECKIERDSAKVAFRLAQAARARHVRYSS